MWCCENWKHFSLPLRRIHQGLQGKPDRGQSVAREHGVPGLLVVERQSLVDEKPAGVTRQNPFRWSLDRHE